VIRQPNVGVIALTNDKKIVLTKEKNMELITLGIPSGKMKDFSPTLKQLKNEALLVLEQEGGYKARNIELLEETGNNSNWYERKYYKFVAWDLEFVGQHLEKGEDIEVILLDIAEVSKVFSNQQFYYDQEAKAVLKALDFFRTKNLI
jgi:hypothetical protein